MIIRLKPVVLKRGFFSLLFFSSDTSLSVQALEKPISSALESGFPVLRLYNKLPFQIFNYQICVIQCGEKACKLQLNSFIYKHGRYLAGIIS